MDASYQEPYITPLFGTREPPSTPPIPLSPAEKAKGVWTALLKMGGYLALAWAGCFLLIDAYAATRLCYRLNTWPHADAVVLSSDVYATRIQISHPEGASSYKDMYGFRSQVRFATPSEPAQIELVDIGYQKSDRLDMWEWEERFPPGRHTVVAYDPANPKRILFAEDFWSAYARVLAFSKVLGFVLGGGAIAVWLGRKLQADERKSF